VTVFLLLANDGFYLIGSAVFSAHVRVLVVPLNHEGKTFYVLCFPSVSEAQTVNVDTQPMKCT
jgi:hypothetical protein